METPHKATIEFNLNDAEGRLAMERALKSREMCITIWSALRENVHEVACMRSAMSECKADDPEHEPSFDDGFNRGTSYVREIIFAYMEKFGITEEMIS